MLNQVVHLLRGVLALPAGLRIAERLDKLPKLFNEMPSYMIPGKQFYLFNYLFFIVKLILDANREYIFNKNEYFLIS